MKVLFDCIVTAKPSKCSSTMLFVTLAKKLLESPDVFIYWPVPKYLTEEEQAWYPTDPRIKYFPVYAVKDRMKEYNRLFADLENLLAFDGAAWDWDVLVTVRSTQTPIMRIVSLSPKEHSKHNWTKRIYLIDTMMVSSHKPTVTLTHEEVQDRMTIEAYLAADGTYVGAYHQRAWVKEMARQHFSAARCREVDAKIHEVSQVEISKHNPALKQEPYFAGRKFGLAFVGRLGIKEVEVAATVQKAQFALHGEGLRTFVCTPSTESLTILESGVIEVLRTERQEFWRICREEMDLCISFLDDAEITMSRIEPMLFGVPLICNPSPCFIGMLGPYYPLYAKGIKEAYALVSRFRDDYSAAYKPWAEWWTNWFLPTYTKREHEQGMYKLLANAILTPTPDLQSIASLKTNRVVLALAKLGGDEVHIPELIDEHRTEFGHLYTLLGEGKRETKNMTFRPAWNQYRVALKEFYGYEDASTQLGHLRKK